MNDPDRTGGQPNSPATGDEGRLGARLNALGARLAARQAEVAERVKEPSEEERRGRSLAFRLATEFVAGILVGGAIGWFFDGWLGTSPWGLIVFVLLGFAAGVLNSLRSAGLVQESAIEQAREARRSETAEGG